MAQCKANSRRTGQRCGLQASKGRSTCRFHGGHSLVGVENPSYRHGRYSKALTADLRRIYEEKVSDPEITSLIDEIALVDTKIEEQLLAAKEAKGRKKEAERLVRWNTALELIEQRRRLADTERKRAYEEHRALTIDRVMLLVAAVVDIIRRHVKDDKVRRAIGEELRRVVASDQPAG